MPRDFVGFLRPCWMTSSIRKIATESLKSSENISNFSVSPVPADGLAPLGAGASAGTAMTEFGSRICMGPALKGLSVLSLGDRWHSSQSREGSEQLVDWNISRVASLGLRWAICQGKSIGKDLGQWHNIETDAILVVTGGCHRSLSFVQLPALPVRTKLASWQLSVFKMHFLEILILIWILLKGVSQRTNAKNVFSYTLYYHFTTMLSRHSVKMQLSFLETFTKWQPNVNYCAQFNCNNRPIIFTKVITISLNYSTAVICCHLRAVWDFVLYWATMKWKSIRARRDLFLKFNVSPRPRFNIQ